MSDAEHPSRQGEETPIFRGLLRRIQEEPTGVEGEPRTPESPSEAREREWSLGAVASPAVAHSPTGMVEEAHEEPGTDGGEHQPLAAALPADAEAAMKEEAPVAVGTITSPPAPEEPWAPAEPTVEEPHADAEGRALDTVAEPAGAEAATAQEVASPEPAGRQHPVVRMLDLIAAWAPEVLCGLSVLFGLIVLRAERIFVAYPNDSSVHSLTVTFATNQLKAGHFPLDGWFPYLSLGSPFFLHYQSISAVITGLLGILIGPGNAFSWTLYLLLATWPISVYFGTRLLGFNRWTAGIASAGALLIYSATGYGFEVPSYAWYGSGLWSQLWGMWLLPLAVGFTWRAVNQRRQTFWAVLTFGLLISFHFLTAYLAGILVLLWVVIHPRDFFRRLGRAAVVGIGSALVASWVLVPLLATDQWSATNEFEVGLFWDNGYGMRQLLSWFIHGKMFDSALGGAGRFPIFTILVGVGILVCLATLRRDERSRVVVGIGLVSLFLTSGRTTFHSLANVLPFNSQVLLHRYVMGIDLAAFLFLGVGVESLFRIAASAVALFRARPLERLKRRPAMGALGTIALVALVVALLAPAWTSIESYTALNSSEIGYQSQIDKVQGAQVNQLIATAEAVGGGRIYAGLPSNWGRNFLVGAVPVYIYLADEAVDAVGFTLRTSSLMTNPEAYFDEANLGDYAAFGIHYLLLPIDHPLPVQATFVQQAGDYVLWELPVKGYFHVVDTITPIVANGTDLGKKTASFLSSSEITDYRYPTIAFDGGPGADPTLSANTPTSAAAGQVVSEDDDLVEGKASATVVMNRTAVVLLSASYDGGWQVRVDGAPATPIMVAPALVGVTVPAGDHTVSFVYQAYPYYPELFLLAILTLLAFGFGPRLWRRYSKRGSLLR